MNWNDLAKEIANMTPEQRNTDVTVYVSGVDKFYTPNGRIFTTSEYDVLGENHPYLEL